MAFNKDIPTAGTSLRASNPQILENQESLQEAFSQDHEFEGTAAGTQSGKHEVITFQEEASAGASATNEGHLQVIDGGTQPEMAFTSEDGTELQLTKDGDLHSSNNLVVDGTSTLTGNVTNSGTLGVTGVLTANGNAVVSGTLDVTGDLDPTTFATTNGGFLNNDTMAGASDTGVASSDSIAKFAKLDAGGTLMHDAEGGFENCDVNGVKTKVYTKYLIGTNLGTTSKTVAHGITGVDNILSVSVSVEGGGSTYFVSDYRDSVSAVLAFMRFVYNGTNVIISFGTDYNNNKYRIKIDYVL